MNKEVSWCNGSTTDFGSVCPSSNLGETTKCISSSVGRAAVSKTAGRRFEPFLVCEAKRDVAQWVGYLVWVQEVACSSRVIPTNKDLLAQLVEHNTFMQSTLVHHRCIINVGVVSSNLTGITKKKQNY